MTDIDKLAKDLFAQLDTAADETALENLRVGAWAR
jgi:hypothetical protein